MFRIAIITAVVMLVITFVTRQLSAFLLASQYCLLLGISIYPWVDTRRPMPVLLR